MNKKTLTALKGSIRKWEKIVQGKGIDDGIANCPLCHVFYDNDCKGCPVRKKTGYWCCIGSPHEEWEGWTPGLPENESGGYDFTGYPEAKKAARAELRFLKSLLPKEE